jgi:hypothetical protein
MAVKRRLERLEGRQHAAQSHPLLVITCSEAGKLVGFSDGTQTYMRLPGESQEEMVERLGQLGQMPLLTGVYDTTQNAAEV